MADLLSAAANRFAAFCAEASVLVFVLGILDRFLLKERIEMGWIVGALVVSLVLLALSVATDVGARRWLKVRRIGPVAH
jgi:cell division protein FtsW (lipid II flippase)